jgi:NTP pyrophosphatase (non-canonical NTP hydrolase)
MTFDEYQKRALTTVISNGDSFKDTLHWVLGLCGESGEVAEKVKKIIRDKDGIISESDKTEIAKELGDVLWYIAVCARQMGFSFDEVAAGNLAKLQDRKVRGTLGGSGDNR